MQTRIGKTNRTAARTPGMEEKMKYSKILLAAAAAMLIAGCGSKEEKPSEPESVLTASEEEKVSAEPAAAGQTGNLVTDDVSTGTDNLGVRFSDYDTLFKENDAFGKRLSDSQVLYEIPSTGDYHYGAVVSYDSNEMVTALQLMFAFPVDDDTDYFSDAYDLSLDIFETIDGFERDAFANLADHAQETENGLGAAGNFGSYVAGFTDTTSADGKSNAVKLLVAASSANRAGEEPDVDQVEKQAGIDISDDEMLSEILKDNQ